MTEQLMKTSTRYQPRVSDKVTASCVDSNLSLRKAFHEILFENLFM